MGCIIASIKGIKNLRVSKKASEEEIKNAETILGLSFGLDYKKYLEVYGSVIAIGFELTGLNVPTRINVLDVTLNERKINPYMPVDMYVIENPAIGGALILQNEMSEIFELTNGRKVKICNSLNEFVNRYEQNNLCC